MRETERDENGESTQVIGPGDDDGRNELDERIRVGASIDSITAGVKIRIGSAGPILPNSDLRAFALGGQIALGCGCSDGCSGSSSGGSRPSARRRCSGHSLSFS